MKMEAKPDNYNINAKICRLVEQYPWMYDRSHYNYLKKDVVDQAWVQIAKEMNDSISSCKERWRNIRTSYARSINVNKIPASANRTKPYYLHEELQFLSRHITPGIPVSRRTLSNSFHTSPRSEKSEVIEVALGEESIDSYAAAMHYDEDKSQDADAERSSSAVSEATSSKHTQDHSIMDAEASQAELAQELETPKVELAASTSSSEATAASASAASAAAVAAALHQPLPMVQIEDDSFQATVEDRMSEGINYACAPPKKRLRVANNAYAMDSYPEVKVRKPLDMMPQPDYDNIFLQGLLPEMNAMDFRQKILFKRRIYEVLSEIFDSSPAATRTSASVPATPQPSTPVTATATVTAAHTTSSPLTVVNAADLSLLRRLNSLLQDPNANAAAAAATTASATSSANATPLTPMTPRCVNISSSVLGNTSSNTPSSITVPIAKIGATTRSSANITRLRMVNASVVVSPHTVKEEPDTN